MYIILISNGRMFGYKQLCENCIQGVAEQYKALGFQVLVSGKLNKEDGEVWKCSTSIQFRDLGMRLDETLEFAR